MEPQEATFDPEREKIEIEKEKLGLEREKTKLERYKIWWTGTSIFIPLLIAAVSLSFSFWNAAQQAKFQLKTQTDQAENQLALQERQARSQFELKAAEIAMTARTPLEAQTKARAMANMFPDRLPPHFAASFDPNLYSMEVKTVTKEMPTFWGLKPPRIGIKTGWKQGWSRPKADWEHAPLLAIRWRLLKREPDGSPVEINPSTDLHNGDRLRVAFMSNQNGHLYVIRQTSVPNGGGGVVDPPRLIFPTSNMDFTERAVQRDAQVILPTHCQGLAESRDCWLEMAQKDGREILILIFSRDEISILEDQIKVNGVLNQDLVNRLIATSGNTRSTNIRNGGYVRNTHRTEDEEIIAKIPLNYE